MDQTQKWRVQAGGRGREDWRRNTVKGGNSGLGEAGLAREGPVGAGK